MTVDDTADAAALVAAQAVARAHGVACDEAVRLEGGSNVLVHLRPAPVVARVMTATAVLHNDVELWLEREIAVVAFVAERSALVAAPTALLPPGPHVHEGLWMTLWTFVPHDARTRPPEPRQLGRSLRELHAVLADFPGALAPLGHTRDWLAGLLGELEPSPSLTRADLRRLRSELDALSPAVFGGALPGQPLHGDVSLGNVLPAAGGPVWIDLEDVCTGPVAWDLAGLVSSARARGHGEPFVQELLAAYGDPGTADLGAFLDAHALYEAIWQAHAAQGRPAHARPR